MFYLSLFVPPGQEPFSPQIVDLPELLKYHYNWGRAGDTAVVIENRKTGSLIGAAWSRLYPPDDPGYGFVQEGIPELSIALKPEYRGRGLGTRLMEALFEALKKQHFKGVSLSVDKRNPAIRLYQRLGFKIVADQQNPTMLLAWK